MAADAQTVKNLRDQTGAGVMDCKAALTATQGDLQAAVEYLRKKGIASAATGVTISAPRSSARSAMANSTNVS